MKITKLQGVIAFHTFGKTFIFFNMLVCKGDAGQLRKIPFLPIRYGIWDMPKQS